MAFFKKKSTSARTRPGSTPQANKSLYAYYNRRSDRPSTAGVSARQVGEQKVTKRKKPRLVHHIPSLILVIALIASFAYMMTVNINPRIIVNDDKNTTLHKSSQYEKQAKEFIESSLLNRSKFTFDGQGLVKEMKEQFPEIATVTVSMPIMGRRPVVKLQMTRSAFILATQNKSVVVGNNGVALADVHGVQNIGSLDLRTVVDKSGANVEVGKQALPQEQTAFISTVIEQLEKQQVTVDTLTIPQNPYDLQVKPKGKPYYIKFNLLQDPKQQTGSYLALNQYLTRKKITPKEYVDVRVGERVFYR